MSGLADHGRFPYRGWRGRPVYDWPGGRRLAVYLALNIEVFDFGRGHGAELGAFVGHPDVLNYSWREYGNRIGAWRLLDLFDQLQLPAAALVNSAAYDHCPDLVAACRARGDEIVGHGVTNSMRQGELDEAAERALIAAATDRIAAAEGQAPQGWLGPWISQSRVTPDLLAEAGYRYMLDWCMDDQPVMCATRAGGNFVAVPYPQEVNDIPAIVARKMNADAFADMIVDQFDEMLDQAADGPLVMGVALHGYIVGQPYRLRQLRRALSHLAKPRDRVWVTTPGAIADHYLTLPADLRL